MHSLQKTLLPSRSAKTLAVRQVSQDNRGKNTAGVDGIKSLTPAQRLSLVVSLRLGDQAAPTRRVWIPKADTTEKRPMGIPTLNDRALQALVIERWSLNGKLVLKPTTTVSDRGVLLMMR